MDFRNLFDSNIDQPEPRVLPPNKALGVLLDESDEPTRENLTISQME